MDPVSDLVRSWKIPVGKWGKVLIDFIVTYFQWLFDALKVSLNFGPTSRARISCVLPGVEGTMMRMGLLGKFCWACTGAVNASIAASSHT